MTATATPKLDRTIELRDGRTLAYSEWGDLRGRPVIHHGGRPGSRLLCPDEQATDAAGVRLITIDRPGYGLSDPRLHRTYRDWVQDYVEFAERLDLPACPVMGWSGGGPYALASAVYAPGRVTSVGLAAIETPLDDDPGGWDQVDPEFRTLIESLRRDPEAAMAGIRQRYQWYADGWESWVASLSTDPTDPDFPVNSRPDVKEAMTACFREAARQGSTGLIEDAVAVLRPWGFALADVVQPVHIWWGEADPVNAVRTGHWLATAFPRATLVTYPGEGHMAPVSHWGEMLAALT